MSVVSAVKPHGILLDPLLHLSDHHWFHRLARGVLNRLPIPVIGINHDCEYFFANPVALDVFRITRRQLLDRHILDIFPQLAESGAYELVEAALDGIASGTHDHLINDLTCDSIRIPIRRGDLITGCAVLVTAVRRSGNVLINAEPYRDIALAWSASRKQQGGSL